MKRKKIITVLISGCFLVLFFLPSFGNARSTSEIVNSLCSKMTTCAEENQKFRKKLNLKSPECSRKLSGASGMLLWDQFGLTKYDRQLKATDVEAMITTGDVLVSENRLAQCLQEISSLECGMVEDHVTKELNTVEMLISDKGACPKVYKDVVPPTTTAGQLIESVCSTYANCQTASHDAATAKEVCISELNGPAGKSIWNSFGLKKFGDLFTAEDVENQINAKMIQVNIEALNECRQQKIPAIQCENFNKYVTSNNWTDIDKVVGKTRACRHALNIATSKQ